MLVPTLEPTLAPIDPPRQIKIFDDVTITTGQYFSYNIDVEHHFRGLNLTLFIQGQANVIFPVWLGFAPNNDTLYGLPPLNATGIVSLLVIVRDPLGREAGALLRLLLANKKMEDEEDNTTYTIGQVIIYYLIANGVVLGCCITCCCGYSLWSKHTKRKAQGQVQQSMFAQNLAFGPEDNLDLNVDEVNIEIQMPKLEAS